MNELKQKPELKIIGLQIDGIKKLKAIEMKPNQTGLVQIRGKNKQGKTSILDALEILIRGNKYITHDMIQHGKGKAEIIGQIGEFTVKRVITENSNRLEITKDGFQMANKPQAFLDALVNELTFNPRPFLDKSPEEKLRFMMDLLNIDFSDIDEQIQENEQERLLIGRELKNIGIPIECEKIEFIDISETLKFNDQQDVKSNKINHAKERIAEYKDRKKEIELEIAGLQSEFNELNNGIRNGEKYLTELPQPESKKDISQAIEQNQKADIYQRYLRHKDQYENKKSAYENCNFIIKEIRENKKQKLSESKMPIEKLEIREDGLYYNNIFCENWSDYEADRISRELCIALNPRLRAMFIDRGETYDSDSLRELEKWAEANNIQTFITIVDDIPDEKDSNVFYIEEGELK